MEVKLDAPCCVLYSVHVKREQFCSCGTGHASCSFRDGFGFAGTVAHSLGGSHAER